jgi:hypothetical protein
MFFILEIAVDCGIPCVGIVISLMEDIKYLGLVEIVSHSVTHSE